MRTVLTATLLTLGLLLAACGDPDAPQEPTETGAERPDGSSEDAASSAGAGGSTDDAGDAAGGSTDGGSEDEDATSGEDLAAGTSGADGAAAFDLAASCENAADGYRIAYPDRWYANDGEITAPCRVFDVQPPQVEPNTVLPLTSSVLLLVEERDLDATHERILDDPATDVEQVEETEIAGRSALRVDGTATGEAYLREDTEVHRTYVAFEGRTLTAQAAELGDPELSIRRDVIHDMLATLEPVTDDDGGDHRDGSDTDDGSDGDRASPLIGDPGRETRTGGDGRGYLTDVRLGDHGGFVRVTLEFEDSVPAYEVAPTDGPIRAYPSDEDLEVDAEAYLEIVTEGTRVDLTDDGAVETYDGPLRLDGPADPVEEVVMSGDHHGVMTWVLGLSDDAEVAVDHLDDPARIVVDVVDDR